LGSDEIGNDLCPRLIILLSTLKPLKHYNINRLRNSSCNIVLLSARTAADVGSLETEKDSVVIQNFHNAMIMTCSVACKDVIKCDVVFRKLGPTKQGKFADVPVLRMKQANINLC